MKKIFSFVLFVSIFLPKNTEAQTCRTDLLLGQNMVTNGDFSQSYSGWTYTPDTDGDLNTGPDGYKQFTGGFSVPGNIYVGTGADMYNFNNAFNKPFNGHTTGAASDNFLMVDGVCVVGIKLWRQTNIPVVANTRYYFSVWINSLKDNPNYPGILNFDVNGTNLATGIVAPLIGGGSAGGAWKKVEAFWDSGPTPPATVTISIEGNQTVGCGGVTGESDFAIDDISFVPGCSYGDPGPQPDLGPDQTLCGKGGSITLNTNVTPKASITVTWNDGTTGTGLGAPYTKVITTPGIYAVCVTDGSSCTKADVIVITNTFSINIGGPYNFCSTSSQTLDAGFSGIGVTYQWYKNGTLVPYPNDTKTYTATSAGTYRVDVTVPGCGTQSSTTTITSTAPVTPIDAYFCATSGAVTGVTLGATNSNSANLSWYTTATGGTAIASGVSTPNGTTSQLALPSIPMGTTATQTYYVEDNTQATGTMGPTALVGSDQSFWSGNLGNIGMYFTANQNIKISSVQIPIIITSNSGSPMNISFDYTVLKSNGSALSTPISGTTNTVSVPGTTSSYTMFTFNTPAIDIPQALAVSDGPNFLLRITGKTSSYGDGSFRVGVTTGSTAYPYAASLGSSVASITSGYVYGNQSGQYGGLYNWSVSTKTVCSRTPVRAISNCPQPVTWTSFYLVPQDNSCKIVWGTANEINNKYFSVERSSDGINFQTIGTITGAGTRDYASNYVFIDEAPLDGLSYYRITQHDIDGSTSSTQMRPYNGKATTSISAYPNPYQHATTLVVSGTDLNPYVYAIYTVSGQLVESGEGNYNEPISVGSDIAKGMYMLTVTNSTEKVTTKIVKQ
ncbi:MAG: T9SS type A sorting domain-containing protein [Cytophaga sp.]|uniref:T9SS type A sorting domain-containing protein n=1 Tax=Cytophaga sp. TaxID=29535 RepID=UPI003F7EAC50